MIIDETTLGELCARVAKGDEQARRDFDRHVLPVVEAIVGRWLGQQRAKEIEGHARVPANSLTQSSTTERRDLLSMAAAAVCAQMVADAAGRQRTQRRRPAVARGPRPAAGETLSALIDRHTVSRLIPWPA